MDWSALAHAQPALADIPSILRDVAEWRTVAPGEVLYRQGDKVLAVMTVVSGELRLMRRDRAGNEIILQRSRGGFLAEASISNSTYH